MSRFSPCVAVALALLATGGAPYRAGAESRKLIRATRTPAAPRIDGRLDDPVWALAVPDDRFVQNFPHQSAAPAERTEVRVLYDDEALYIAVRCDDSKPDRIVERLSRRDRDTDADKIEISISSRNDSLTAYAFNINAAGVLVDAIRFDDTNYSTEWDGLWLGRVARDAGGWSAELKIPLRTLRYHGDITAFGFQVRRLVQRDQEVDEWAPVPRTARGEVSYYGQLGGLYGLKTKRLFQLLPYAAGKLTLRTHQAPLDGLSPTAYLGADLKLGLTPALTFDLTVNPDFGQVEADQVVLNLTTFEVFYPEKRPFFLEGSHIFYTPFQQFYSRRIGRTPPEPSLSDPAALAEPPAEGRIWAAAKVTGHLTRRLSVGVLEALTARQDATIVRAPGLPRQSLLVEPLSNFMVLRLKQEFAHHSHVGLLGTAVNRFEPPGAAAPMPAVDQCPDGNSPASGLCTHDAYTLGLDTNVKTADGAWGAAAHLVGSAVAGGPARLLPDGVVIGPGDTGWGLKAEVGKYGGEHWLANINYSGRSPKLDLNDAGFLDRANAHRLHPQVSWRHTKPYGALLESGIGVGVSLLRTWDGSLLHTIAGIGGSGRFSSFWQFGFDANWVFQMVDNRETRDGAFTERAGGYSLSWWVKSDNRRRLTVAFSGNANRVLRGHSLAGELTISLRPIPALELDLIPRAGWTFGDPRWYYTAQNLDGSRSFFFGDLESESFDVTLRGTYTFTTNLTLQAYSQLFVAAGHYGRNTAASGRGDRPFLALSSFQDALRPAGASNPDFRRGALNINLVLRWEYRPLSTLLLVYTHAQQQAAYDPIEGYGRLKLDRFGDAPSIDVLLLKLSYLWG